jgi:hypothetical protein
MPWISKKSFQRIQRAGREMSNVCFNLSQVSDQKHTEIMKAAQVEWDAAIEALRQEWVAMDTARSQH